jgi:hypothetical protein
MPCTRKYPDDHPMVIACRKARKKVGAKIIASEIHRTWQAVYHWKIVPDEHVLTVSRLSGISKHTLRPDRYGIAPWKRKRAA